MDAGWIEDDDRPSLTARERQVLHCVASGMTSKEAAIRLGLGPRTVDRHIDHLRYKLRARNKTHMVAKAIASGELERQD